MKNSIMYKSFDEEQVTFVTYLVNNNNGNRLGVTPETQQELGAFFSNWAAIYYNYIDPNKRTSALSAQIRERYESGLHLIHGVREQIRHNSAVELTAADRVALKIAVRHAQRNNIPAAAVAPVHTVFKTVPGSVTFNTVNTINPAAKGRGMPKDQAAMFVLVAVLDADRPPTEGDFRKYPNATRMRFTVQFEPADRHKTGYIKTAWRTHKGLQSPIGEPLKFRII